MRIGKIWHPKEQLTWRHGRQSCPFQEEKLGRGGFTTAAGEPGTPAAGCAGETGQECRRDGRAEKISRSAKQSRADEHLSFRDTADRGTPSARGLYDPALDKDSCGVGFIADLKGRKSHKIIDDGLTILLNLEHRGAVGADPRMGDGAGILVQIPHKFFVKEAARIGSSCRSRANMRSAICLCRRT